MEKEEEEAEDKEEGNKEGDEEIKLPRTKTSPEDAKEDDKEDEEKRVMDLYDSFTPQPTIGTCEQEDRERKSSSTQELDVSTEEGGDQKSSSPKALDKTSEVDIGRQVMEDEFKDGMEQAKEGARKGMQKYEDKKGKNEEFVKEEVTTKEKLKNWWMKKKWRGFNSPYAEVHPSDPDQNTHSQNKYSEMEPAKTPDETENRPDKTCDDICDRAAYTGDKDLEGPDVLHKTKYGSEKLLGMKTAISAVRGTRDGKAKEVKALADPGASAYIISWTLAKKVNLVIF